MDGALPRRRPARGKDRLPEQEVRREAGQLRLGRRVLQLQGVGHACTSLCPMSI